MVAIHGLEGLEESGEENGGVEERGVDGVERGGGVEMIGQEEGGGVGGGGVTQGGVNKGGEAGGVGYTKDKGVKEATMSASSELLESKPGIALKSSCLSFASCDRYFPGRETDVWPFSG